MYPFGEGTGGGQKTLNNKSTPGPSGHPRQRGTNHLMSPFGGGRGGGWETRRQETGDNFKPLLTMCKPSTPGPLKQATPAGRGQEVVRYEL